MIRHTKTKAGAVAASAMLTLLFAAPLAAAAGTPHPNGGPTPAATTTTITGMASTFVAGDPISVNVSVAADPPGGGTPTGTVTVSDGGSQTCPVTLAGGTGSCSITEATPGPFSFTATYSGDSNFASSGTAAGFEVTVGGESSTTTISSTTAGPVVGQPITVNFGVTGSGTPTGTVTVSDGGSQTCSGTLVSGVGSCQITETTAGAFSFTATYSGDTNFASSVTSTGSAVTVVQDDTTTSITSTTPGPVVGQPITVGVDVGANAPGGGTPTGTVTVSDGGVQTCEVVLIGGAGACQVTETAIGPFSFTATYNGDTNFASSTTSTASVVTVGEDATTTSITSTTLESGRRPGHHGRRQRGSRRAGSGTPTGTVTVSDGGTHSCPVTLAGGAGSCQITETVAGHYSFSASYAGDSNDASSATLAVVAVTVAQGRHQDQHHERGVPIRRRPADHHQRRRRGRRAGQRDAVRHGDRQRRHQTCIATLSGGTGELPHHRDGGGPVHLHGQLRRRHERFLLGIGRLPRHSRRGRDHNGSHGHDRRPCGRPADHGQRKRGGQPPGQRHAGGDGDGQRRRHPQLYRHACRRQRAAARSSRGQPAITASRATYEGDTSDAPSVTSPSSLTVAPDETTTAITGTTPGPVVGQPITVGVSVEADAPGNGTPAGTVTVSDGTNVCMAKLNAGAGSCKISATTAGDQDFTASYGGSLNDASSATPAATPVIVGKATTKTALKLSGSRVTYGDEQAERLSVTVSPQFAGVVPSGKVTLKESTTTLCVIKLSSAKGSCTLGATRFGAGVEHLVASYGGSSDFDGSSSSHQTVTISDASTRTALELSASKVTFGDEQAERISVTVSPEFARDMPAGQVTVQESKVKLCVITLSSAKGSCALSATRFGAGVKDLVATYGGSSDFEGSASATQAVTVLKATSRTTLQLSTSGVTYGDEQAERLSVTVSPQFAGVLPAGKITVKTSAATLCVITLSSAAKGSCTLPAARFPAGIEDLVASYGGSSVFEGSASGQQTVTVARATTRTGLRLSAKRVTYGHERAERLSVSVSPEFAGTPTGTVTVTESKKTLCVITLSSGTGSCTLSATRFGIGKFALGARYNGSSGFHGSSTASAGTVLHVSKATSSTALRLSASTVAYGHEQSERLSVTVSPEFAGTPTGTVTVRWASSRLCVVTLSAGKGSCTLAPKRFGAGTFHLKATYTGDSHFDGSDSAVENLTVPF